MKNSRKNGNFLIGLILAASALKWLAWVAIVPFFQMPDEPAHFCYVQKLAETRKLFLGKADTSFTEEVTSAWREGGQEELSFSRVNKYDFSAGEYGEYEKKMKNAPLEARSKLTDIPLVPVQYPPLYYLSATPFYNLFYSGNILDRDFAVRIFSALLGLFTVFIVYKTAGLIFPKHKYVPETIALLVSFNPMFTFISASINSDCLLNALFSLYIYYYIKICLNKHSLKDVLLLAAVVALGFLTKQPFILSLVILVIALFFFLKLSIKIKLAIAAGCLLVSTVAFVYLSQNFPMPVISSSAGQFFKHMLLKSVPFFYFDFIGSFFGNFGWLDTPMPNVILNILFTVFYAAVLLFLVDAFRSFKKNGEAFLSAKQYMILAVPAIIYILSVIYIESNTKFGLQGRYFFPVISLIYSCLLGGLLSVIPEKFRARFLFAAAILTVLLNMYCLFGVIVPKYYL